MKSEALARRSCAIVIRMIVASLIFIGSACGNGVTDSDPELVIRISGTVYSAATQAPIEGAEVELWSSDFGFLGFRGRATTDAAGTYSLEVTSTCLEMMNKVLLAKEDHFRTVESGEVRCIAEVQIVNFVLLPV